MFFIPLLVLNLLVLNFFQYFSKDRNLIVSKLYYYLGAIPKEITLSNFYDSLLERYSLQWVLLYIILYAVANFHGLGFQTTPYPDCLDNYRESEPTFPRLRGGA